MKDLNEVLMWASNHGELNTIKYCLDNGADVHAREDWALRWASNNGHTEVVRLLLDNGADVHADEDYALRWASNNGHTEVVKLLKEAMKEKVLEVTMADLEKKYNCKVKVVK